jgi:hypothetical protein
MVGLVSGCRASDVLELVVGQRWYALLGVQEFDRGQNVVPCPSLATQAAGISEERVVALTIDNPFAHGDHGPGSGHVRLLGA